MRIILPLALVAVPAVAQQTTSAPYMAINPMAGVPVFATDISDRPYVVIGEVRAGVRKATIFSDAVSERKIYRELWERAAKMGADAVINARYGNSHVTAISWGKTNATGTAIRFTGPATSIER